MARYLDEQAPGQYRQEVASAARETLAQAATGQVQLRETAPLFQMLQRTGDAEIAGDLARTAPQWNYYSTMALAGMSDGQGIPALVQSTQEAVKAGKNPNSFALQMLAQTASQSSEAAAALVEQARQNQIPDWTWTKIVEGLAGDQYQLGKPPSDMDQSQWRAAQRAQDIPHREREPELLQSSVQPLRDAGASGAAHGRR